MKKETYPQVRGENPQLGRHGQVAEDDSPLGRRRCQCEGGREGGENQGKDAQLHSDKLTDTDLKDSKVESRKKRMGDAAGRFEDEESP